MMGRGIGIGEAFVVIEQKRLRVDRIVRVEGVYILVVCRRGIV